jgi:4-amino-4-deoxy-L-arabinose transferase-like glycosyltransferase
LARVNRALPLLVLLLLAAALYLRGLGQLPFCTIGEPREALEIWEEIHNGEWVLPYRNGIDLSSKPPLFHWLGGLTALATGEVDEFAARFPSALAATLTLLLVYWFAAKRYGAAVRVRRVHVGDQPRMDTSRPQRPQHRAAVRCLRLRDKENKKRQRGWRA